MPDASVYGDGVIYVSYSHMDNAADDLVTQTAAIARTLEELNMELNALVTSWEGDDQTVYVQKQTAWNNAVTEMENLLSSHAVLLTDISGNYTYSEQSLASMWSDVAIGT
ncbi:WXG100 family type VII secretion target [Streptomyces sp. NPDC056716]|uniref:WXG100 family type VII secretion target n=1 Tax=unclassified Streptomyces TaxID=2593676 RepID=UPI0036B78314